MSKRLIQKVGKIDDRFLRDVLYITVNDIEDSMIECGLEPGKDYTRLDLFKLAVHIVAANNDSRWQVDDGGRYYLEF